MKTLVESIVRSRWWFWNWELVFSITSNTAEVRSERVYQHKYTGERITVYD